jgi:hypothetical protein
MFVNRGFDTGSDSRLKAGNGGGGGRGGGVASTDEMFTDDGDVTDIGRFRVIVGIAVTGKENGAVDGMASVAFTGGDADDVDDDADDVDIDETAVAVAVDGSGTGGALRAARAACIH